MVPAWSSFPQRPQFESSVIQRSISAFVKVRGYLSGEPAPFARNPSAAAPSPHTLIKQSRRVWRAML